MAQIRFKLLSVHHTHMITPGSSSSPALVIADLPRILGELCAAKNGSVTLRGDGGSICFQKRGEEIFVSAES